MSRSRKRTPILFSASQASEKQDKRWANRRFRRLVRVKVANQHEALSILREVADVWDFRKDGRLYQPNPTQKEMRK